MAAASPMQGLQEDATCSICLEYYKDPVITKCGHNFCRACITECSEGTDRALPCPQCRELCSQGDLQPNRQLQSIVENVKQLSVQGERPQGEGLCEEHEEKLKLYCEEDKKLICLICQLSSGHKTHNVRPLKEAAQEYMDVRSTLSMCEHVPAKTLEGIRKKYKVHVTLDADTAQVNLKLSEAGRRVTYRPSGQTLPDNPKRFTDYYSVLGTEGFSSGRHYWELEILQDGGWCLGVAQESVSRKTRFTHCPEEGFWVVMWHQNQYKALTSPHSPLSPRLPLRKVGVYLDYEGGRVSVYNASTKEALYTFIGASFTDRVYPYFNIWDRTDLRRV